MVIILLIFTILLGIIVGILIGLVSVGGSIILTSILIIFSLYFQPVLSMKQIVTTTSIFTLFTLISGTVYYSYKKLVDKSIVYSFGLPAFIASIVASLYSNSISDTILQGVFVFFALCAVIFIIYPDTNNKLHKLRNFKILIIVISVLIGIIGGMIGVGAGFLFVPIFMKVHKLPIKKAIGTGMVVGAILCVGTIMGKLDSSYIRLDVVLPISIAGVFGAMVGGRLTKYFKDKYLHIFMSSIIALLSIQAMASFLKEILLFPVYIVVVIVVFMIIVFSYFIYKFNREI